MNDFFFQNDGTTPGDEYPESYWVHTEIMKYYQNGGISL
jgi:hypothetical protein